MAQSYYTLEQAAEILNISADELKQMARRNELRSFSDGGSMKFRSQDIDEMKRTREWASEGDFLLEDGDSSEPESVVLFDEDAPAADSGAGALQQEPSLKGSGESDVRLIFGGDDDGNDSGIRVVADDEPDAILPFGESSPKPPGDSDIRLIEDADSSGSAEAASTPPEQSRETDTSESKVSAEAGDSGSLSAESPASGSGFSGGFELVEDEDESPLAASTPTTPIASGEGATSPKGEFDFSFDDPEMNLKLEGEEEVDLESLDLSDKTPTLKQEAGDDSDSDFSLSLDDDIGLSQDITPGAGDSGINLGRPDDSGILLKSAADSGIKLSSDNDTSDSEFEVSLDSDDDIFDSDESPGFKASDTAPRMSPVAEADSDDLSDSDFELAIDEDVEVEDESGSEVVALDDEDEESDDFDEEYEEETPYGDREAGEPVLVIPQPAPWHVGWVVALSFTTMVFVVVLIMMFEITRNAWSYNQPYALNASIIEWFYGVGQSMGIMP